MHKLEIKTLEKEEDIIINSNYIKFQKNRQSGNIKEILEIGFETVEDFNKINVSRIKELSEFEILTIKLDDLLIYENLETNYIIKSCYESTEGIISLSNSNLKYYLNLILEELEIG